MIEIGGKYTSAIIHTDTIEDYAIAQIRQLCDQPAFIGSKIQIMPDVHPGQVGPIGFTATVTDKVMPAVVGLDIGCGIKIARIRQKKVEFQKLDSVIRETIPSGSDIRLTPHRFAKDLNFEEFYCASHIRKDLAERSIGTLGSGNHFIELDRAESGDLYVVIHTGSRHLGKEVAENYLQMGHGRLSEAGINIPYELSWLEESQRDAYIHDVSAAQAYAAINRQTILDELVKGMKWKIEEEFDCVHNYIGQGNATGNYMIRKGAISAEAGEKVVIPVNMKEGIILGIGKGNPDWNCSAPHGAGRIASREAIRNSFTVSQYKKEMKGIYSSCIGKETLDEAPFAYHTLKYIREAVIETVDVQEVLHPIYNFKAGR